MVEDTEESVGKVMLKKAVSQGENVRLKGEEIKKGQLALGKGTKLNPASLGYLISLGVSKEKVIRKPKVSLLATGNELAEIGRKLKPGQIWESNLTILSAALSEMDIEMMSLGIARDDRQQLEKSIVKGLKNSDILLICGGISVGDSDYVQESLLNLNIKKIFWSVAIKPGKPTFFGILGQKLIFGLPGNPASVLVTFLQFVRPAIRKMMGYKDFFLPERLAILHENIQKKAGRVHFLRGRYYEQDGVSLVISSGFQSSHMMGSFSTANCLIYLENEKKSFPSGTPVRIQVLPWS